MLSSIKEFLVDNIFSGRKRIRPQTSAVNLDNHLANNLTEAKHYQLKSSNFKSFNRENIIDLLDDKKSSCFTQDYKEISIEEILKIQIQISTSELTFYEKLNSFSNLKNDLMNYPSIGTSEFLKLISLLHYNFLNLDGDCSSPNVKISQFLNLQSLRKLAMNHAIDDEIIDSYIDLLQQRQTNNTNTIQKNFSTFFLFKTSFYQLIKTKEPSSNRRLDIYQDTRQNFMKYVRYLNKNKVDLSSYKRVLIPILLKNKMDLSHSLHKRQNRTDSAENSENFHWALVSVNMKSMKMILYDSKYSFSEEGKSAMQTIAKFFDYQREKVVKTKNSFSTACFSEKEFICRDEIYENRFDSEESSDDEDSPDNSTPATTNKSYNFEEDVYANCKRVLNFDENDSSEKESGEKKATSKWRFKYANNPRQSTNNGIDSGIFVCKFMEYLAREEPILFSKNDIEYFRILISIELIESKLMTGVINI